MLFSVGVRIAESVERINGSDPLRFAVFVVNNLVRAEFSRRHTEFGCAVKCSYLIIINGGAVSRSKVVRRRNYTVVIEIGRSVVQQRLV